MSDQFAEEQLRKIKTWPQANNGNMPFSEI